MSMNYTRAIKAARNNSQLIILALLLLLFSVSIPSFLTEKNIVNILKQSTTLAIVACGLALVVIGGNLDLSVGSLLSLTLGVSLSLSNHNIALAVIVPLAIGCALGLLNGAIVGLFSVSSIIVMLGSLSVISGFVQFYRKGNIISGAYGSVLSNFTDMKLLSIPSYVLVYIGIALIYQALLVRTTFGRKLVYIGTNRDAAVAAGLNVRMVTIVSFVICSFSVALASILQGARLLQGSTNTGAGLEFDALTAILVGGISLRGGKGSIANAMIGVFLLATITNALALLNVPFEWRNISKGILILIAIASDAMLRWKYDK
jgi:ribose/xylose/arabinose/galactoside ABC-type transport system permease subunit